MPTRGFLSGQAFEPEVVRQMSLALETIWGEFEMNLTDEPATRVVASKIIELAQRGVHDAPTLTELTRKEVKHRHVPVTLADSLTQIFLSTTAYCKPFLSAAMRRSRFGGGIRLRDRVLNGSKMYRLNQHREIA
jgi:hypothetical protein